MRYQDLLRPSPEEPSSFASPLAAILTERTPTKPAPALTPAKARKEQARKDHLAKRMQAARNQCASKVASLTKQMFEHGDRP